MEVKYYVIIENDIKKYLKAKVSRMVITLMLKSYTKICFAVPNKKRSFEEYLFTHGIECEHVESSGYFNVDEALKDVKDNHNE